MPSHRERAQTLFNQRRDRAKWFGAHAKLFQDPTWGILLEFFLCGEDGRAPSTTSVAYGTAVPTTTLRALHKLKVSGLVESWTDAKDTRVRRVRLSQEATRMMRRYLDHV
ncbi:hypothetical protein [Sphingomonas sp. BAUL-RG-20F-R05-02]|uniref:hypothetical protein n=1 Tax=Sphingomonas sp. BAUL-RG-20F-R05-02 TaxID=2914830 RepID=UPI001F585484|nr:hypothetical protein [Sphingomonas sp. BAUL-RG-20F-R05-02]